jgi:hypothetical protein
MSFSRNFAYLLSNSFFLSFFLVLIRTWTYLKNPQRNNQFSANGPCLQIQQSVKLASVVPFLRFMHTVTRIRGSVSTGIFCVVRLGILRGHLLWQQNIISAELINNQPFILCSGILSKFLEGNLWKLCIFRTKRRMLFWGYNSTLHSPSHLNLSWQAK